MQFTSDQLALLVLIPELSFTILLNLPSAALELFGVANVVYALQVTTTYTRTLGASIR
jgi:hypothetical protein